MEIVQLLMLQDNRWIDIDDRNSLYLLITQWILNIA